MIPSFLAEIKMFTFWLKTMNYSPWFDFYKSKKVVRNVYHLKGYNKRNPMALVSVT